MTDRVSKQTQDALREASERLLSGKPMRGTSALTVVNLAKEAGVSRATANRAKTVLAEFGAAVELMNMEARETRVREEEARLRHLERTVKARNEEIRGLRERCDKYAQEIQFLNLQHQNLERELRLLKKRWSREVLEGQNGS